MPWMSSKLNHRYVMLHLMEGTLRQRLLDLPGEVQLAAEEIERELMAVKNVVGDKGKRFSVLYSLVPPKARTGFHKYVCRNFHDWLVASGQISPPQDSNSTRAA
jgi:hypothetical protein